MNNYDIDYKINSDNHSSTSITPPKNLAILPMELSERIPAEIWRIIAFHTVNNYNIHVTDSTLEESAIQLIANDFHAVKNMQLVSRAFDEGTRSGFRDGFTGSTLR